MWSMKRRDTTWNYEKPDNDQIILFHAEPSEVNTQSDDECKWYVIVKLITYKYSEFHLTNLE